MTRQTPASSLTLWLAAFWRLFLFLSVAGSSCSNRSQPPREIILATTTSTQDSGLLNDLLPDFQHSSGVRVKVIAVGTGEALALGVHGDADVLLVHAPAAEADFMAAGNGSLRLDVMHNDFLLTGPSHDPAKAKGEDISAAFRRIHQTGAAFVSRGDKSGTHKKEIELWQSVGTPPPTMPWYISTGQGMGDSAVIASEKQAYLLIDRGTWLSMRSRLALTVISEGDPTLRNPYGVIVVSPTKFPRVRGAEATQFAQWLVSPATQKRIAEYGKDRFGQALFVPDARREARP